MSKIVRSVGRGGVNLYNDVIIIQKLLNKQRIPGVTGQLKYDGDAGKETITRIEIFQKHIVKMAKPDGRIDPGGKTMAKLVAGTTPPSKPSGLSKLTEADFQDAVKKLGADIEVAMIKALAEAESGGRSGFSASGFPKIAFEGHKFQSFTKNKYDETHPLLSYIYVKKAGPEWQKNNKDDATAQKTLEAAMELDRSAAYRATSWGMFQVLGDNFKDAGFSTIDAFVESMKAGELGQMKAFVGFCKSKSGLAKALANKDFKLCARLYNGPNYGDYDEKIRKAYEKYSGT